MGRAYAGARTRVTTSSRSRSSIRGSSRSLTSVCSKSPTPRRVGAVTSTPTTELRERYAAAAGAGGRSWRDDPAAGADHLVLRTDRDWVVDLVRFVAGRRKRRRAAAAGGRPLMRSLSSTRHTGCGSWCSRSRWLAAYVVMQRRRRCIRGAVHQRRPARLGGARPAGMASSSARTPPLGARGGCRWRSPSRPVLRRSRTRARVVILAIDTSLSMEGDGRQPHPDRSGQGCRNVVPQNDP